METLLDAGADRELRNKLGRAPLHECVLVDNRAALGALVAAGADPRARDGGGLTAGQLAESRDNAFMADMLEGAGGREGAGAVEGGGADHSALEEHHRPAGGVHHLPQAVLESAKEGPVVTVEEEKEALRRRLAELEEGERRELERRKEEAEEEVVRLREDFRRRREETVQEIQRLQETLAAQQVPAPPPPYNPTPPPPHQH